MSEDNHYDLESYIVFIEYENCETYYEYIGNDKERAQDAFVRAKHYLSQQEIVTDDCTLTFKNTYTEEIIDTYNPLDDA